MGWEWGQKRFSDEMIFEERPGFNARLSRGVGAGLPVIGKRGDDGTWKD